MAIERMTDPSDGVSELIIMKGKIEQISFKALAAPDQWGNTHRAGVRIGTDWANSISLKTKEGNEPELRINGGTRASPDWMTVEVGDEVRIQVTENHWNGKVYLNAGVSNIRMVKKGAGKSSQTSGGAQQGGGNLVGVVAGNARTSALNFLKGKLTTLDKIQALVTTFLELTDAKRKEYAALNPQLSEYQVGVSVGQAVAMAATFAKTVDEVGGIADTFLALVAPSEAATKALQDGIKAESPKPTPKPAVKSEPPAVDPNDLADMDDDIPFN